MNSRNYQIMFSNSGFGSDLGMYNKAVSVVTSPIIKHSHSHITFQTAKTKQ